jgi:hypothetical protein
MTASPSRFSVPALAVMAGLASFVATPLAAQAVSNTAEFEAWRKVQKEDIDGLREKFMALAKAVPADKLKWKPMEGTRSFHDVFAHMPPRGIPRRRCSGSPYLPAPSPTSTPRKHGSANSRMIS